jgi:putative transposase
MITLAGMRVGSRLHNRQLSVDGLGALCCSWSMARPLRIDVEGGWYHVTARGIERRPIFLSDRHCEHFLELLEEMSERHAVEVHAFVLVGNHYHLIIRTPHANASQALQWLNVSYSVWFNAKQGGRVGHVFQGRFSSKLIDDNGSWLITASCYLHLNPVRTSGMGLGKQANRAEALGLVKPDKEVVQRRLEKLRKYPWNSYRAYAGYIRKPEWLRTQNILARGGGKEAYRKYVQSFVTRGDNPEEFETLKGRLAIGSVSFVERAKKLVEKVSEEHSERKLLEQRVSLQRIVKVVEELKGESWDAFNGRYGDWGRALVFYLARKRSGLTLRQIGDWAGGLNYKTVSHAVTRFEDRLTEDKSLAQLTKHCVHELAIVET